MNYNIFPPSSELKDIVKQYIVFNSLENIEIVLFLPNGGNFIIFNRGIKASGKLIGYDELFHLPKNYSFNFKTNRVKQVFLDLEYKHDDDMFPIIVIELLPIGFYKLFSIDMTLSDFKYEEIPKELVDKYFSKLYNNGSISEEFKYLDNSLIKLARSQNNSRLPIEDVVDKIYNDYQLEVTVENLLEEFNFSRSTMERNFKKMIGLTPKNFIFVSKFSQTLLEYIEEKRTFHEIQYLYSDNSHMNAVFQKFLGIAPSEIFKKVLDGEVAIFQLLNLNKSNELKRTKMINPLEILEYSKKLNVLYVEDDDGVRNSTHNLLKIFFNSVETSVDGQDGLQMYLNNHESNTQYDLIITDINMPNMNGIEMSREIFKIENSQVIMILSENCEYLTAAKELGIRAILTKPVDYKELSYHIFEISKEVHNDKIANVSKV